MSKTTKNPLRGVIILALDLILFFTLLNTLPFSTQENRGLALLIFVGILWLTEAFNITVTSLMVPIFAIMLNVLSTKAAFAPFSEPIIFMFFGGFVIAAVLNMQKIDLWIANHIIRLAKGRLKLTIIYLFIVTAGLSLFINNTAVAALMLPLTLGILHQLDFNQHRRVYVFVLLGIAFSSSIGGMGTLVGSAPNALLAAQIKVSFSEWLAYGIPVAALLMVAMVFSLLVVLRPNFNVPFEAKIEHIPLNAKRIATLLIFILTALCLTFSSLIEPVLRQALALKEPIKSFDAVIAMIAVIGLCITSTATWKEVQEWIEKHTADCQPIEAIGSGGNINKIHKNSNSREGDPLTYEYLTDYYTYVSGYTYDERIRLLGFNPDRADVILYALTVFINAMKWSKATIVHVPRIGLADGIVRTIYNKENQ